MLLPFCTNLILPGFLRKLLRVELWTENRFGEICDFVMIFDTIWYWNPWKVDAKTLGHWGWLQEDRHKATAVVDPGNRWRGVWWRSRSKKSFQYEEKEGPYNVYILWHIHIPSIAFYSFLHSEVPPLHSTGFSAGFFPMILVCLQEDCQAFLAKGKYAISLARLT